MKLKTKKKTAAKVKRPLTDRQMFDQAVEAVGYWSEQAKRWEEFATATQSVCVAQQREIEALRAEVQRLSAPRVGCDECQYTGLFVSPVDEVLSTGEVVRRRILCPNCRPVLDEFIDRYVFMEA